MKKLLLFDGNNHFRRLASVKAYQFMSFNGKPTGAMAGTLKHVLMQIQKFQPDEVCVVFDGAGAKTVKQKQYAGYKAQRMSTMDDGLYMQMIATRDILRALGLCVLQKDGVDGDDCVGALAELPNRSVLIDSNDKDFLQELTDSCSQIRRHESVETLWTVDRVIQHFGVRPSQFADYLALVGDGVDGIPGLRQCGPQEAVKLLTQYGSLDNVLKAVKKSPHQFNEKLLARIRAQYDQLLVFQKLTRLDTSVISDKAMQLIVPRLTPKNYSNDLKALLDSHGLNWVRSWVKIHKPNVRSKAAGLWS